MEFVGRVCGDGSNGVPAEERIAVFDNDGTLWCEKPLPIQADFILRRLFEMAEADPALRGRQPWKAAYEHDYAWLGGVLAEHYAGDDTNLVTLSAGVLAAHAGSASRISSRRPTTFCALRSTRRSDAGKPIRIWSRTGRRPLLAAGNSNGDVPMLDFTQHDDKPSLRLLVLHDDAEREFDYTTGAEQALERAKERGWTIVSVKNDWATVF